MDLLAQINIHKNYFGDLLNILWRFNEGIFWKNLPKIFKRNKKIQKIWHF